MKAISQSASDLSDLSAGATMRLEDENLKPIQGPTETYDNPIIRTIILPKNQ